MEQSIGKREVAVQFSGIKKMYKLGQIGGGTLQADLQSWWARKRGKEDPNAKIGREQRLVGQTFMALNGIDLTVYKGEALGIIGGNGAGKSTMLKLLSRVTAPTDGTIEIHGRVASMLEVGTGFNGEMTGRENVYMNGAILGMTKAEIDAKMEDIIEFSEVRDFIDTPVKRYSSGMYVKLAFSVAAHLDSEIMIMDEVLAVGDMAFQKKCLDKMREAAKKEGRTVLYVSHNMNTIRQLCDRCVVLDKGRVVFEGDVEEAIERYIGKTQKLTKAYRYDDKKLHNVFSDENFYIESLAFENVEEPCFQYGDIGKFNLICSAKQEWAEIFFRLEIQYKDGTLAGTMLTDKPVNFTVGTKSVAFLMDTSHLAPGMYRADVVAFLRNPFGDQRLVDGVYPGFAFKIIDGEEEGRTMWRHRWWGHVRLHDLRIKDSHY